MLSKTGTKKPPAALCREKKCYILLVFLLWCTATFSQTLSPETQYISVPPSGLSGWDSASATWRVVGATPEGKLIVDVTIGSVTVSVFPVYANAAGNPATAAVDISHYAMINLASDTVGLVDGISSVSGDIGNIGTKLDTIDLTVHAVDGSLASVSADIVGGIASVSGDIARLEAELSDTTTIRQQTITLTPGVVSTITSLSGRRSISIKAYTSNVETTWLSYDNVSTAAAVLSGDELTPGARISIDLPEGFVVGVIASTAETIYVCEQGD